LAKEHFGLVNYQGFIAHSLTRDPYRPHVFYAVTRQSFSNNKFAVKIYGIDTRGMANEVPTVKFDSDHASFSILNKDYNNLMKVCSMGKEHIVYTEN
jgi:hypothetical protein